MRPEFSRYLEDIKSGVEKYIEIMFESANNKSDSGLKGFKEMNMLMEIGHDITIFEVIEVVKQYEKIEKAFETLHAPFKIDSKRERLNGNKKLDHEIMDKEFVNKNNLSKINLSIDNFSIFQDHINSLKRNGNYYKGIIYNTNFSDDEVKQLAKYINTDDHKSFFSLLANKIDNKSTAGRYTKAIFGKAPKHKN